MIQLNPFEIKSLLNEILACNVEELPVEKVQILDSQEDKKTIVKLLYKELYNLKGEEASVLCFLLERYADKNELVKKLWDILKNNVIPSNVKIVTLNFLRGIDSNWEIDAEDEILNEEIIDAETAKLLNNAVINPEIQIDFLDFLSSISSNDKLILIDSLAKDYDGDALANILVPVFLSSPDSEAGIKALQILGESRSQLAFHALNSSKDFVDDKVMPYLKKSLSTLKIAGIRSDNSREFYKNVLSDSIPYKFYATYPDGHGNIALVFSRKTDNDRIRFVAVAADDYHGIRDCFGFYDISQFEFDKIVERFFKNEHKIEMGSEQFKSLMLYYENISKKSANNWLLPYEYVCWKNLLSDVEVFDINSQLDAELSKRQLLDSDLAKILDLDFAEKWFLDSNYSDEFEHVLSLGVNDIDNIIEQNLDYIFYDEEKYIWAERLLIVAFLYLVQDKSSFAELIYSLYFEPKMLKGLFRYIIQKSIYEYYVSMKYNFELNNGRYSKSEIDDIIAYIEGLWVCTK